MLNYYELLEIEPQCGFDTLKKAYYKKAKECHPDRFQNSPQKTAEFQLLVEAFNVLSDAERRKVYDEKLHVEHSAVEKADGFQETVMDTDVDDTLEELIVGNDIPENATLLTLFQDLERTHVFMTWREGKYFYSIRRYRTALETFQRLVRMTPTNILYRVYLARTHAALKNWGRAKYHYKLALAIGKRRRPPQRMVRIQRELENVSKKQFPVLYKIKNWFWPNEINEYLSPEEIVQRETNRSIARILREQAREEREKKLLK